MLGRKNLPTQGDLHNDWVDDLRVYAPTPPRLPGSLDPSLGFARGLLLLGIGVMLLAKVLEGAVSFYIHPRYEPLIAITAVGLLILAVGHMLPAWGALTPQSQRLTRSLALGASPFLLVALWSHSPLVWSVLLGLLALPLLRIAWTQRLFTRVGWTGFWLALPIVLGLLVASKPLGTAALDGKNILNQQVASNAARWKTRDPNDTAQWTLVDWATSLWQQDPSKWVGRPVDVVGFIYRPRDSQSGMVHVARFVVACCTADSSGVSLALQSDQAASLETDTWVRVVGALSVTDGASGREPYIQASEVTVVPRPAQPYLYP